MHFAEGLIRVFNVFVCCANCVLTDFFETVHFAEGPIRFFIRIQRCHILFWQVFTTMCISLGYQYEFSIEFNVVICNFDRCWLKGACRWRTDTSFSMLGCCVIVFSQISSKKCISPSEQYEYSREFCVVICDLDRCFPKCAFGWGTNKSFQCICMFAFFGTFSDSKLVKRVGRW